MKSKIIRKREKYKTEKNECTVIILSAAEINIMKNGTK